MTLESVAWWQAYAEWYAQPRPWDEMLAFITRVLDQIGGAYRNMMPSFKEASERLLELGGAMR